MHTSTETYRRTNIYVNVHLDDVLCAEQRRFVVVLCIYLCNVAVVKTEEKRRIHGNHSYPSIHRSPNRSLFLLRSRHHAAIRLASAATSFKMKHRNWIHKKNTQWQHATAPSPSSYFRLVASATTMTSSTTCRHGFASTANFLQSGKVHNVNVWHRCDGGARDVRQSNREWCSFPRVVVAEAAGVPSLYKFTRIHIGTWTCLWSACGQPQHNAVFQSNS